MVLNEEVLRFQARVIRVEDGQVLLSALVSQNTTEVANIDFNLKFRRGQSRREISTNTEERRDMVMRQVLKTLARRISAEGPHPSLPANNE